LIKVMKQAWYNRLDDTYGNVKVGDLPSPVKGVPMSQEEYDYKTYYTRRVNRNRIEGNGKEGKVYLISDNVSKLKIGITRDVPNRVRTLSLSSGRELTLITTYTPMWTKYSTLERMLHEHYKEHRTLGEWFTMTVTEKDFLEVCLKLDQKYDGK